MTENEKQNPESTNEYDNFEQLVRKLFNAPNEESEKLESDKPEKNSTNDTEPVKKESKNDP